MASKSLLLRLSNPTIDFTMSDVRMPCDTGRRGSITVFYWAAWQHCPINAKPEYAVRFSLRLWRISKRAMFSWVKSESVLLSNEFGELGFLWQANADFGVMLKCN